MSEDRGEINEDEEEEEELDEYDDPIPVFEEYGWTGLGPIYAPPGMDPLELLPDLEPEEPDERAPPNVYVDPEDGEFYYPYELGPDDDPIPEFDPDLREERPTDPVPFDLFEPPPVSEPEEPDEDISPNVYVDPKEGGFFYPYELLPDDVPIPEFDPDPNEKPPFEPIPWVKETPEEEKEPNSPEAPSNPQSPTLETGPMLLEPLVEEEPEEPIDEFEEPDELEPLEEPQPLEEDQPLSNEFDPNYETDMPLETDSDENLDEIPIDPEFDELELLEEEEVNEYFSRFDEQTNPQLSEEIEEKSKPLEQTSDKPLEEVEEPETDVEEIEEPSLTFQKEISDKITKVYSNGEIEIEESLPKVKGRLPINLRLWLEMNKHVKDSFIEVLIDYIYESEKGEKTTVKKVKAKIFLTPEGIVIQLPEDKKGDLVRELLARKGRIKARFPNLLKAGNETISNAELRKRLKAILSISNLTLRELVKSQKMREKNLVYENVKQKRGTEIRVYSDGTLEVRGSVSSNGLLITNEAHQWKALPKSKADGKISVKANFEIKTGNNVESKLENVDSEIYNNNYYMYIRPIHANSKEKLLNNKSAICEIPGVINNKSQLETTERFDTATKIREKSEISDLDNLKLILTGGQQEAKFEIYQKPNGELQIRSSGKLNEFGHLTLSEEIGNLIENWFDNEEMFLSSINGEKPIVVPSKIRIRTSEKLKKSKELNFPIHNPGSRMEVNVTFTNPDLKLSDKTQNEMRLTNELKKLGINVEQLRSEVRKRGGHKDKAFEQKVADVIEKSFSGLNQTTILTEVEIVSNLEKETRKEGSSKCLDYVIRSYSKELENSPLVLIELKTPEEHSKSQLDKTIANVKHMHKRISSMKTTPVVIYNHEIKINDEIKTKEYGDTLGVILLGPFDIENIITNPESFVEIINDYNSIKHNTQKANLSRLNEISQNKIQLSNTSIKRLEETNRISELETLEKYHDLLEDVLPEDVNIYNIRTSFGKGADFEQEVRTELENEGFDVVSNVVLSDGLYSAEIDHLAFDVDELTVVSCKNKSDYSKHEMLLNHTREDANKLEIDMDFVNATNARFYEKVPSDFYDEFKDKFEGDWTENLSINIRNSK